MAKSTGKVPARPKIYHITHLRNLARIASDGFLFSDAKRVELNLECAVVGLRGIKKRRLEEIEVACHPFGMELLATVHWVMTREGAHTKEETASKVYDWNARKRVFQPLHIARAVDVLRHKDWVGTNGNGHP